jgi:hypothetical protein
MADNEDLWNLDHTISEFVLPKLKRFAECAPGYPGNLTQEAWADILSDMIYFHEQVLLYYMKTDDEPRLIRGRNYFGEYYSALWW